MSHWLTAAPVGINAGKTCAGVALLIASFVCLRNAYVALGMVGLVLAGLLRARETGQVDVH